MKFGVHGVNGKMGRAIVNVIADSEDLSLAAGFVRNGHPWVERSLSDLLAVNVGAVKATDNLDVFCAASDVVIDFTRPEATLALLPVCRKYGKPMMIGTTGFNEQAKAWINAASQDIPIILAANTSIGVNVLMEITRRVAAALPADAWHADILDLHHCHKDDAPSGTALRLGQIIAEAQGTEHELRKVYPYQGRRKADDIGYAVIRAGEIIGEHTVFFTHADERLELTHRAGNRDIFARGALTGAKWLVNRQPGLYSMADVLGFTDER